VLLSIETTGCSSGTYLAFDCSRYSFGLHLFCLLVDMEQLPHTGVRIPFGAVLALLRVDRAGLPVLGTDGTVVEGES